MFRNGLNDRGTDIFRFLWVAFQIEDLCRQKSDAEIRHSLKTLPKDLPETYQRALSRIVKEGNGKLANKIFRWVAAAKRPLDSSQRASVT